MKVEVVRVNQMYAARFRKWYHVGWRYIGIAHSWPESHLKSMPAYVLVKTKEDAEKKLQSWFPQITKAS